MTEVSETITTPPVKDMGLNKPTEDKPTEDKPTENKVEKKAKSSSPDVDKTTKKVAKPKGKVAASKAKSKAEPKTAEDKAGEKTQETQETKETKKTKKTKKTNGVEPVKKVTKEKKEEKKEKKEKKNKENDEEPENDKKKIRTFKVKFPESEVSEGRFTGTTPYQAANKALSKYFRDMKKKPDQENFDPTKQIKFSITESTRKSKKSEYFYNGQRINLETPVDYNIRVKKKDEYGNETEEINNIVKRYKNIIKKIKKNENDESSKV